jgi:Fungal specific transcription factor domain
MAEMRDILDPPSSEDDEDISSPDQSNPGSSHMSHQGFIFGYSSMMNTLRTLHPSPSQVFGLMLIFEENVEPIMKILHRPTTRGIIMKASSNTDTLSKSEEALLFSVYYGAVCSLTPSQCEKQLGEDKEQLANRFRFAVEQALARANFLNSSSLMVLQAFVMFLICVRTQDDTRLVWSLSGLTTHLAQALGVHRDGTNFGLSPFETEMRRRLWWHICLLDTRAAEDHGADPSFTEAFYDAKLPLNINDDDISPETKETPKERQGTTEMTFCLIRFELSAASRRMNFAGPGPTHCGFKRPQKTLEEREKMIEETHKRMDALYFQYCDMTVPCVPPPFPLPSKIVEV